jgi:diadenosine tetraphosphate (Ap4A) HIT family hydrolase
MNATMKKFGYPDTLIKEYLHWVVLLRPQQATLGSLVLICKDEAEALSRISLGAFTELKSITADIEAHLKQFFSYDKLNYLMLMMVDRDVHFHVLPRYAQAQIYNGAEFNDPGWPGPPDLTQSNQSSAAHQQSMLQTLRKVFAH